MRSNQKAFLLAAVLTTTSMLNGCNNKDVVRAGLETGESVIPPVCDGKDPESYAMLESHYKDDGMNPSADEIVGKVIPSDKLKDRKNDGASPLMMLDTRYADVMSDIISLAPNDANSAAFNSAEFSLFLSEIKSYETRRDLIAALNQKSTTDLEYITSGFKSLDSYINEKNECNVIDAMLRDPGMGYSPEEAELYVIGSRTWLKKYATIIDGVLKVRSPETASSPAMDQ